MEHNIRGEFRQSEKKAASALRGGDVYSFPGSLSGTRRKVVWVSKRGRHVFVLYRYLVIDGMDEQAHWHTQVCSDVLHVNKILAVDLA